MERNRRRQHVYVRFLAVALPLVLLGLVVRFALGEEWGMGLYSDGMFVNVVGYAAAALLHAKPLHERPAPRSGGR